MALSQIETASLSSALVAPTATALTTASGSAPSYSARAWVNFNGTGTVAIRASGNCSSITDNGVGDYTFNFSTAMVDANYVVALGGIGYQPTNASVTAVIKSSLTATVPQLKTTTQLQVMYTAVATAVAYDCAEMNVSIFR